MALQLQSQQIWEEIKQGLFCVLAWSTGPEKPAQWAWFMSFRTRNSTSGPGSIED